LATGTTFGFGFGFATGADAGIHAGGVHGSSSGKRSTEKHSTGLCTWGGGFFVFLVLLTTLPQVSLTLTNASQSINPQNKINKILFGVR